MIEFYDGFYAINFPDIIFADKVILYEGDTERMLIKNALLSERFEALRNQYISFVQVDGAYAINYKPILDYHRFFLLAKSLNYAKEKSRTNRLLEIRYKLRSKFHDAHGAKAPAVYLGLYSSRVYTTLSGKTFPTLSAAIRYYPLARYDNRPQQHK